MANSTQSNVSYSNEIFKQYLIQLSSGIVWKNTTRANANEPTDVVDLYLSELFVVANRGLLNFDIVKSFPRAVLQNAGIPEVDIERYATDKRLIPQYYRDTVVKEYEKVFTTRDPLYGRPAYYNSLTKQYETIYDEPNNYYRMLIGLPNVGDTDYVYNTDRRWDTKTPVHLLPYVDRLEMESAGIIAELIEKHPSKEYLRYIGKIRIDLFNARIADRFEILYKNEVDSDVLNNDFSAAYNNSRQLVMSVYYNISFQKINALYDNFLAMSILFMTLQTMQYRYLQIDVTRDFYDLESLKLIYDSYGVPFYNEIPLEYHRKIVKNINRLISYKGSSQVFLDLFEIFDIGSIDIYSYFLTKKHLFDASGNPIFNIKKDVDGNDMYDGTGNPILDASSFEIKFSKVKIYDDPALSISDSINDTEYELITENDPYWIEDPELAEKLASEDFNYLESKYIGVQMVFDLMKITYENAYAFRMITDNKELIENLEFRWSDISVSCSVYDAFIYLATLYCRNFGYEGVINTKLPAVMNTLGYNFQNSLGRVRSSLLANDYLAKNEKLMLLLNSVSITNLDSLTLTYDAITEIRDMLIEGYTNATTVDEFNAYRELYNSLMISKELESVYTNPRTGELYETFTDVLSDSSPELMQRYLLLNDSAVSDEIELVTSQLQLVLTSLKFLPLSSGIGSSSMIDSLFRILNFFKSAKAELVGSNISYMMTMRGTNFLKLLDKIVLCATEEDRVDNETFIDMVGAVYSMMSDQRDMIRLLDEYENPATRAYITDYINKLDDELLVITDIIETLFSTESWYIDFLHEIKSVTKIASSMAISDMSSPELIFLDIIETRYSGKFRDNIMRLTDRVMTDPNIPVLYYCMEILNYIDTLKPVRQQLAKIKDSGIAKDVLQVVPVKPEEVAETDPILNLTEYFASLQDTAYCGEVAPAILDQFTAPSGGVQIDDTSIDLSDVLKSIVNTEEKLATDNALQIRERLFAVEYPNELSRDNYYSTDALMLDGQLSLTSDIRALTDALQIITESIQSTEDDNVLRERISHKFESVSTTDIISQVKDIFSVSNTVETSQTDGDNYPDVLFELDSDGNLIIVN